LRLAAVEEGRVEGGRDVVEDGGEAVEGRQGTGQGGGDGGVVLVEGGGEEEAFVCVVAEQEVEGVVVLAVQEELAG